MVENNPKPKANPDYSKTAVNLTNPEEIRTQLLHLKQLSVYAEEVKSQIKAATPDLSKTLQETEASMDDTILGIKALIDSLGSFQDPDAGLYALKVTRTSKSYNVYNFKAEYPQYVPAVIVETVNEKALQGLIKGGLLTEAELIANTIIELKVNEATIVKV